MFTCFGANESCWRSNNKTTSGKEMVLTGDGHRPLLSLYPSWFYLLLVAWVTIYIPLRLLSESSSRMATSIQEDLQCLSDRHQGTRGELGNLAAGPVSGPLCSRDRMTSSRLFKRMFLTKQSESDSEGDKWDLCSQPSTMQLNWHPPRKTRTGRLATGIPFSSQMMLQAE